MRRMRRPAVRGASRPSPAPRWRAVARPRGTEGKGFGDGGDGATASEFPQQPEAMKVEHERSWAFNFYFTIGHILLRWTCEVDAGDDCPRERVVFSPSVANLDRGRRQVGCSGVPPLAARLRGDSSGRAARAGGRAPRRPRP